MSFQYIDLGSYILNVFWILYNIIALIVSIKVAYHRPDLHEERMIKINKKIPAFLIKTDADCLIIECIEALHDYFYLNIPNISNIEVKLINQVNGICTIAVISNDPIIQEKLINLYTAHLKAFY